MQKRTIIYNKDVEIEMFLDRIFKPIKIKKFMRVFQNSEIDNITVQDWQEREKIIWKDRTRILNERQNIDNCFANINIATRIYNGIMNVYFVFSDIEKRDLLTSEEIKNKTRTTETFGRYDFPIFMWSRLHDWGFPENSICIVNAKDYAFCGYHDAKDNFWVFDYGYFTVKPMMAERLFPLYVGNIKIMPEIGFNLNNWWKYELN